MKNIPYILAFCCLLSCTKPADVTPQLERAEQLMTVHPDSALTLLESLQNPEELSPPDRALWGLLLTQARDKNYVPHTSDSLITRSIEYFRTHDDVHRLAWSYYYDGMIHYELEEFELSQAALLQAEEAATEIADFDLLGRVYENLGTIYRKQGLMNWVLPMHHKALEANQREGDSTGIGIAYRNLGAYYITHDLDSAEICFQQALSWLQSEPYHQSHVFNDLARVYRKRKDYEKALKTVKLSLMLFKNNTVSVNPIYLNLANIYTRLGKTDSAIVHYQRCLQDTKTRTTAHKELSEIYSQLGDYQKAYTYGNRYAVLLDSVRKSKHVADLAIQLNKHEKEKAIAQLEREHTESKFYGLAIGTGITISLLVAVLVFMMISRRRKDELARLSKDVTLAQQKYQQMVADKRLLEVNYQSVCEQLSLMKQHHVLFENQSVHLQQLKEDIECRLKEKEAEITSMTKQQSIQLEDLKQYCLMGSSIYRKLTPLMGKKREMKEFKFVTPQESDWENFFQQIDFVYPGFVIRLRDEYQLKDEYLKLACFILLNIYPCNMKNIYNQTAAAITNKRNSLAERLGVSIDELDAFLQTFSEVRK